MEKFIFPQFAIKNETKKQKKLKLSISLCRLDIG